MTPPAEPDRAAALSAVIAVLLLTVGVGGASGWTRAGFLLAGVVALLFATVAFRRKQ